MDKYDPAKKVALVVDEWGIWTNVEPGTNPGFLYQQNSMRDALIAATTLNIFNNHCERVKMACLAQTVNVLQSLILTKKEKMILTPTYYVFDLYKVHQDAHFLPVKLDAPDYEVSGQKIPAVNISASQDAAGKVHISLVNLDATKAIDVKTSLGNIKWSTVKGQMLTSANLTDINTFENPGKIKIIPFTSAQKDGDKVSVKLPAHSIVVLELM
jgi:alpha-N-arabinofuranosidase